MHKPKNRIGLAALGAGLLWTAAFAQTALCTGETVIGETWYLFAPNGAQQLGGRAVPVSNSLRARFSGRSPHSKLTLLIAASAQILHPTISQ